MQTFEQAVELHRSGQDAAAEAAYRELLAAEPTDLRSRNGLGVLLMQQRRYEQALAQFDRAVAQAPKVPLSWSYRGLSQHALRDFAGAVASYDRALKLEAEDAELRFNRANSLGQLRRFDEAIADYDRSLELQPDFATARRNRGILKLMLGDFRNGLDDYEARRPQDPSRRGVPRVGAPEWTGESLSGRSILVTDANGFGDEIQMLRYLPLLDARGATVSFIGQPRLYRLFAPFADRVRLLRELPAGARFDYQCKLLSLPWLLGTTRRTIPAKVPYLEAEPRLVKKWKERIGGQGFRIGIGWQGSAPRSVLDAGRSLPLAGFGELAALPGVRLISLQKGGGTEELEHLPDGMHVEVLEGLDELSDAFVDTAAVMANLDLVISSCSALPHLAGALARPVWLAAKYVPEWSWGHEGDASPWYPTMRVFRQQAQDDWAVVFAAMKAELQAELQARPAG